jgi:NAD(P)H-hydrate epimerase
MRDFPPLLTAAEMRAADAGATRDLGVPSLLLMENAGRGTADILRRELTGHAAPRVAIVCGGGANGGDGFVIARQLAVTGMAVDVTLTAPRARVQGDAATMLAAIDRLPGVSIEDGSAWSDGRRWRERLAGASAIVDAIFGIGIRGEITGPPAAALAAMNGAAAFKLAVDIPSGLDADTGRAAGVVFRADVTATMGARKLGLVVEADAPVGRVEVVDLGAPMAVPPASARLLDEPGVADRLPRRRATAHKGSSGHLLVVAGSPGKTGAAVLVGQAALRAGAGLVTLASTPAGQKALDAKVVEVMTARYPGGDDAGANAADEVLALASSARAVAIGPGIPTGDGMRAVVRRLATELPIPALLDADALNLLATDAADVLAPAAAPRVLTPHPGEMARLLGLSTAAVQADRVACARRLAAAARAIVVLKGARTVIAAPDGGVTISPIACAALATAGSGDVLGGVIAALLARDVEPLAAAQVGVFAHGRAGENLAGALNDGVIAGDLPLAIADVMARLGGAGRLAPGASAARPARLGAAPRRRRRSSSTPKRRRAR